MLRRGKPESEMTEGKQRQKFNPSSSFLGKQHPRQANAFLLLSSLFVCADHHPHHVHLEGAQGHIHATGFVKLLLCTNFDRSPTPTSSPSPPSRSHSQSHSRTRASTAPFFASFCLFKLLSPFYTLPPTTEMAGPIPFSRSPKTQPYQDKMGNRKACCR